MSFRDNIRIKDDFNNILDKNIWIKHEEKTAQKNIGGFYYTVIGKNVDFKIDCYNNRDNIVLEERQISGTSWLTELDEQTIIAYVKINTGYCFCWTIKQLKQFKNTKIYKNRKSLKSWSGTTFKNFKLHEMPPVCFILKFDVTSLYAYLKEDRLAETKYENIITNETI